VARLESGFQVFKEGMVPKKAPKRQIRKTEGYYPSLEEKSSKMF
jgi:hypothetical protein